MRSRKLCAEIARKNCKIPRISAHRAHKNLRALGQCTLRTPHNIFAALHRVFSALKCKEARVTSQDHANLPQKSREIIAKFPGILTRLAQRKCFKSVSMRCVKCRTSLKLLNEPAVHPNTKKCAVDVDVAQVLRQTRAKKLQNFRNSGAPRAQKLRAFGQQPLRMLQNIG